MRQGNSGCGRNADFVSAQLMLLHGCCPRGTGSAVLGSVTWSSRAHSLLNVELLWASVITGLCAIWLDGPITWLFRV